MADEQVGVIPSQRDGQPSLPGQGDEEQPSLDTPQVFTAATSYQVRDKLEEWIRRDLLGPWDGEHEIFRPRQQGPRERYLVGMLGPKPHTPHEQQRRTPNPSDVDIIVQGDASEGELPEVLTIQSLGKMWASSMGLFFAVPLTVDEVAVTATWGSYDKREIETPDGKRHRVWARQPVSHYRRVPLDVVESLRLPLTSSDPDAPGVLLTVEVRRRDDRRVVRLALVNAQNEPSINADTAWLFQCGLTVTAPDGKAAVFLPIDEHDSATQDAEEAHLRLLYRNHRRYAVGRNAAVQACVREGELCAHKLETTWLPTYDVPATEADVSETSRLAGVELSMDALATADAAQLRAKLAPLADGYAAWLDEREAEIPTLPDHLRRAAETAVFKAQRVARRIRAGIDLLTQPQHPRHAEALAAFHFANEAMALQRRRTEIVRLRETGLSYAEALAAIKERGSSVASWRPFQLAFILLNLPALTDPEHPERVASSTATVDLLFFPTGGGKTEAYLGLAAYTFAIRRLQGTIGTGESARSGAAGMAVLMRYTLRLLTAQQFQRAATLVCAAEVLRRRKEDTWGREPFRIGLWVGSAVSPNWFEDAATQVAQAREAGHGPRVNVLHILSCPWCGETLRADRDLHADDGLRRVLLFCPNAEGVNACPFSRTRCAEGLPILTVDEEIYRLAPSLVVATVDKLAQLPWRGYAGMLFGRVSHRCPRHGFRHDDLDAKTGCKSRHNSKGPLAAVVSQPVVRLRPPDLIIQDELHLISGALGTTVGLFEAAVDELCTWRTPSGKEAGPKIVASTATTKRAREQVMGVFGRDLSIFPPPVLDVTDTFFSHQVRVTPHTPGRRYLGICAHGVKLKSAEIRLAEILLLAGQTLFDRYGKPADPYLTVVGYFNTTRELAGMRRYLDDDVATRVRIHGRRRGLSNRITLSTQLLTVHELTSRISSGDISHILKQLEIGFDPELDTTPRRRAIAEVIRDTFRDKTRDDSHPLMQRYLKRRHEGLEPADVVLATSMLQVGVDVARFGLMVITGQPKNTAEYIQASSRVGRDPRRPGLVITLYHWSRPRDLAHYEDFEHYHATFYRHVEALSVTPYARRALDRGTTGTLVAAIRNAEDAFSRNTDAHDVPLDSPRVNRIVDRFLARAEAAAGPRGRGYLEERINRVKDHWALAKTSGTRLGYETDTSQKQHHVGLLQHAGSGPWGDMTVGDSMRETEQQINLLLPTKEVLFSPLYGAPGWRFAPPNDEPDGEEDERDDEELPEGDEFGESALRST